MKLASQFLKITAISLITAFPELSLILVIEIMPRAGLPGVWGAERSPACPPGHPASGCPPRGGGGGTPSQLPANQGTGATATDPQHRNQPAQERPEELARGLGPPGLPGVAELTPSAPHSKSPGWGGGQDLQRLDTALRKTACGGGAPEERGSVKPEVRAAVLGAQNASCSSVTRVTGNA